MCERVALESEPHGWPCNVEERPEVTVLDHVLDGRTRKASGLDHAKCLRLERAASRDLLAGPLLEDRPHRGRAVAATTSDLEEPAPGEVEHAAVLPAGVVERLLCSDQVI